MPVEDDFMDLISLLEANYAGNPLRVLADQLRNHWKPGYRAFTSRSFAKEYVKTVEDIVRHKALFYLKRPENRNERLDKLFRLSSDELKTIASKAPAVYSTLLAQLLSSRMHRRSSIPKNLRHKVEIDIKFPHYSTALKNSTSRVNLELREVLHQIYKFNIEYKPVESQAIEPIHQLAKDLEAHRADPLPTLFKALRSGANYSELNLSREQVQRQSSRSDSPENAGLRSRTVIWKWLSSNHRAILDLDGSQLKLLASKYPLLYFMFYCELLNYSITRKGRRLEERPPELNEIKHLSAAALNSPDWLGRMFKKMLKRHQALLRRAVKDLGPNK